MKSLSELLNESLEVNEGMKTVDTTDEASELACKKYPMCITYVGKDPEKCYKIFKDFYGVESIFAKDSDILFIPCSKAIEKDLCYNEEKAAEKFAELGIPEDDFEW